MSSHLFAKYVGELKNQQASLAESAMLRPRSDVFEHGVLAGRYQGIQNALDALENLYREEREQEIKS